MGRDCKGLEWQWSTNTVLYLGLSVLLALSLHFDILFRNPHEARFLGLAKRCSLQNGCNGHSESHRAGASLQLWWNSSDISWDTRPSCHTYQAGRIDIQIAAGSMPCLTTNFTWQPIEHLPYLSPSLPVQHFTTSSLSVFSFCMLEIPYSKQWHHSTERGVYRTSGQDPCIYF